jgi:misacylated tRNA(Ala) deacylase
LAGQHLSCSNEEIESRVKQLLDNQKETLRREKRLRDELADFVASKVLEEAQEIDGITVGAHIRQEDSTNDQEFLLAVYTKLKETLGERKFVFALAQVGMTTPSPDGCLVIGSSDEAIVKKIGDSLKKGETAFGSRLRGGGKGRWQGKLSEGRLSKDRDEPVLLEILKSAL